MPLLELDEPAPAPAPVLCPVCQSPHVGRNPSCSECGYYFSPAELAAAAGPVGPIAAPAPALRLQDRFEVGAQVSERQGVQRFRGLDHGANPPAPVWIIREPLPPAAEEAIPMAEAMEDAAPAEAVEEEILPGFDDVLTNPVSVTQELPRRPQLAERRLGARPAARPGASRPAERRRFLRGRQL